MLPTNLDARDAARNPFALSAEDLAALDAALADAPLRDNNEPEPPNPDAPSDPVAFAAWLDELLAHIPEFEDESEPPQKPADESRDVSAVTQPATENNESAAGSEAPADLAVNECAPALSRTGKPARQPKVTRSVNVSQRKCRFWSSQTLREINAMRQAEAAAASVPSIVCMSYPSSPSSSSLSFSPSLAAFHPTSASSAPSKSPGALFRSPSRRRRSFEHHIWTGLHKHRTYPAFKFLTGEAQVEYLFLAIRKFGTIHKFDLNLREDIEMAAKAHPDGPADYLHRRISDALQKALKRPVEFVPCLEETDKFRLHAHGVLDIQPHERKKARKALRKAGGEWPKHLPEYQISVDETEGVRDPKRARKFQAKIPKRQPDEFWAAYCSKHFHKASAFRQSRMGLRVRWFTNSFAGKVLTATDLTWKRARELYAKDCADLCAHKAGSPSAHPLPAR